MRNLFNESIGLPAGGEHRSAASGSEHRSAAAGRQGSEAQRSDSAYLLEIQRNVVTKSEPTKSPSGAGSGRRYKICSAKCQSFWCPKCCGPKGYGLRMKLAHAIRKWRRALMITLTIDPELFEGPAECWEYMRKERCVSIFMRELRRRKLIKSKHYFCVTEIQEESTNFPHFHLLIEAAYIPQKEAMEIWSRFRPDDAGPIVKDRPGFGFVWFSNGKSTHPGKRKGFMDMFQASCYLTKYLLKPLKNGVPEWIDNYPGGRVVRYSISKGFWGHAEDDPRPEPKSEEPKTGNDGASLMKREFKTVKQRRLACGDSTVLISEWMEDGKVTSRQFMAAMPYPWDGMKSWLDEFEAKATIFVPKSIADDLMQRAKHGRWHEDWMHAADFAGMEGCEGTRNPFVIRAGWTQGTS